MLFDSTLRRELARTFGATLVIILTIVLTMMLIRTLGQAALGRISPQDVVLLLGYFALAHLPTILSLSLFIAIVATLGRMYRESEMVIWFASGMGLSAFVKPVMRVSTPVLLAVALLNLFIWPWVNRQSAELREQFEHRSDLSRVAAGQFQSSRDGKSVFFIDRDSAEGTTGRNVFILTTKGDTESVISARSGHIENTPEYRFLILERGQRNELNLRTQEKSVSLFQTYKVRAGERVLKTAASLPQRARYTLDLMQDDTPPSHGELTWRLGLTLGSVNLLLLAIGLSATQPRRATNWNLLFALLAFVIYYNLINLSQAWVAGAKVSMGTALAVIHGGALLAALGMLWWRDYGTLKAFFRKAPPPMTVSP